MSDRGYTLAAAREQLRQSAMFKGRGWPTLKKIPNPAAGGSWTYPIPAEYWLRVLSIAANIQTSSAAGLRSLNLNYLDGDGYVFNQVPVAPDIGPSSQFNMYGDLASVTPGIVPASITGYGQQTSPAAGTTILSEPVPAGDWQVQWSVESGGTTGANENNNYGLYQGSALLLQSENGTTAGQPYPQPPVTIEVPTAGSTISVKNINIGTTGAIYEAQLAITRSGFWSAQLQIPDFLLKSGWQLQLQLGNAQAADQISGIGLLVEEYPSGDIYLHSDQAQDQLAETLLRAIYGG